MRLCLQLATPAVAHASFIPPPLILSHKYLVKRKNQKVNPDLIFSSLLLQLHPWFKYSPQHHFFSFQVTSHVSHLYKITGKVTALFTLVSRTSDRKQDVKEFCAKQKQEFSEFNTQIVGNLNEQRCSSRELIAGHISLQGCPT
jgi:hypothetical protein